MSLQMSEVKRRSSGQNIKSRSAGSSATTSRESLQEVGGASSASSDDLKTNGRKPKSATKSPAGAGKMRKAASSNGISHNQSYKGETLARTQSYTYQQKVSSPKGHTPSPKGHTLSPKGHAPSLKGGGLLRKSASLLKSDGKLDADGKEGGRKISRQYSSGDSSTKSQNKQSMSHDRVRKIVQEEGRSARNLIAYNVPAVDDTVSKSGVSKSAVPKSPRKRLVTGMGRDMSPTTKRADDSSSVRSSGSRPASSVDSQATRKTDMRARYWAFLFDNLKRAVDEIYQTCESDESVNECKEVIMILQQCTKDFQSLINQWNVIKTYEHLEESGQRPVALAWEVRKTSPGKPHLANRDPCTPSPAELFSPEELSKARKSIDHSASSWADMVRGRMTVRELEAQLEIQHVQELERRLFINSPQQPTQEPPTDVVRPHVLKLEDSNSDLAGDIDGWETVRRSRSKTSPISKASTSSKGSICSNSTGKFQKPSKGGPGDTPKNGRKTVNKQDTTASNYKPVGVTKKGALPAGSLGSRSGGPSRDNGRGASSKRNIGVLSGQKKGSGGSSRENGNGGSYRDAVVKTSPEQSNSSTKKANQSDSFKKTNVSLKQPSTKSATPRKLNMDRVSGANDSGGVSMNTKLSEPRSDSVTADADSVTAHSDSVTAHSDSVTAHSDSVTAHSDSLLMVAESYTDCNVDIGLADLHLDLSRAEPTESEEEDVLAMEIENALSHNDEALNEQDAAIKSAIQKEQNYLLEIEEAEREEMPHELANEFNNEEDDLDGANSGLDSMETSGTAMDWEALMSRYEAEAERRKVLGLSWADIDDAESRTPGRGAHMHEKLSSPSRKRSIMESKKRHEERQAKAAELRESFRQEKAERVKDLTKKVEEVRSFKDKMEEQRRDYLDKRLHEAEEKRKRQLKMKVKKAHEEKNKANEIAFINTLSEQNKKMDIMTKHEDVKARLMDIQEERQRKIGEKAAKEAAVEERRKALDAERSARLAEMQMKRKRREGEIEHEKYERDKERTEALKTKEKEHKDRLAEIERQQQASIEELQKKIEQKQTESARRHSERLQNIREKAFIMNILKHSTEDQPEAPKLEPYNTKKMCTVCNMVIPSEVHLQSHLRGQQHQNMLKEKQTPNGSWSKLEIESFNIEHIKDVPGDFVDPKLASSRERSRSLKKRCKKLRHRMQARGNEFEAGLDLRQETVDSQHKAKLNKIIKDVNKFIQAQEKGPWPQNKISALDRGLGEAIRILDKKVLKDQIAFRICGGLSTFTKLLLLFHGENVLQMYPKTCSNVCQVIRLACRSCFENCHYFLFSNRTGAIIDLLVTRLRWMVDETNSKVEVMESATLSNTNDSTTLANLMSQSCDTIDLTVDVVATALVHTLAAILSCLSMSNPQSRASDKVSSPRPGLDAYTSRTNDVISYVITVGIVDGLQSLYTHVRGSLDTNNQLFSFLQYSISFLTSLTKLTAAKRLLDVFESGSVTDSVELMQTYEDIELAGIMSLLYGMLLHNVPTRGETPTPPTLSSNTLTVTLVGLKLINQLATMDFKLVQRVLGAEGVSLELRHIISYLIWYCTHHLTENEELLHEVILCIGYFVALNQDNQAIIQSGQSPTILQQLCSLPFQYFSDPRLVMVLYPCLICCCYLCEGNRLILEQELSCDLLSNFLEESLLRLQQHKLSGSSTGSQKTVSGLAQLDGRVSLAARFPEKSWLEAKLYFCSDCHP